MLSPEYEEEHILGYTIAGILKERNIRILQSILILPFVSKGSQRDFYENLMKIQKLSDIFIVIDLKLLLKITPELPMVRAFDILANIIYHHIISLKI